MKKTILVFSVLFFVITQGFAQDKLIKAIDVLSNTQALVIYDSLRTKAQDVLKAFKQVENRYSETSIQKIKIAYNASAKKFNQILFDFQNDLLDKKKRKLMIEHPDVYSASMMNKINEAKGFYATNFRNTIYTETNGDFTGFSVAAILAAIEVVSEIVKTYCNKIPLDF